MDIEGLKKLAEAATPGPWSVWTSNSWRRISATGDGDVLHPTKNSFDGHPDLAGPAENLAYIAAANPKTVLALIRELEEARRECGLLNGLINTVMNIPNMSNEQLAQLRANCQVVLNQKI